MMYRSWFERGSGDPEECLEVDGSEMLQLRKACRLVTFSP